MIRRFPNVSIIASPNWIGQTDPGIVIKAGYEFSIEVPQPTTVVVLLGIHPSREHTLLKYDAIETFPEAPGDHFLDANGNRCSRFRLQPGTTVFRSIGFVQDSGLPDFKQYGTRQHGIDELPPEVLPFLYGSRYCETDLLSQDAWNLFGWTTPGFSRVQTICDWVNANVEFGYCHARNTRTALETFQERRGVCRDFAHLSITLCRAMNIPARYVNGYLGDIAIEPNPSPMDFNAWFEAYLDGSWHLFDARHNEPRVGRIPIAKGKDAADVAMITTFGPHILKSFQVWTEQVA
jgi:transglutaminase-like putative cysteine protease